MNNFCLFVGSKKFEYNNIFLSCIFDLLYNYIKENSNESSFSIEIPEDFSESDYCDSFQVIFDILRGCGLIIHPDNLTIFSKIADQLGIQFITNIIQNINHASSTVEETFESFCNQSVDDPSFDIAVSILAQNLSNIDQTKLLSLPLIKLDYLFQSDSLYIPNEDFIFQFYLNILKNNYSALTLLQYIHLYAVSSDLLLLFLNQIHVQELTSEFFDVLKSRLSFPVFDPSDIELPSGRWQNQTFCRSEKEREQLIKAVENISKQLKSSNENDDEILFQNEHLKSENQDLRLQLSNLQQKLSSLQQDYQNNIEDIKSNLNTKSEELMNRLKVNQMKFNHLMKK